MSDKVGAVLRLSFSSMLPEGSGHDNGTQASLRLAYLKTYEHVGVFSATCISGCNCTAQKVTEQLPPLFSHSCLSQSHYFPSLQVNCHFPEDHVSLMQLHQISASQSPECMLEVRIEAETTSGEHKVRAMQLKVWLGLTGLG